jgi:hypothetical protein
MNTNRKGNISEAKVLQAFVQKDFMVLTPFGNGAPYDLAVDLYGRLLKVQVKTGRLRNGCIIFPMRRFSGHIGKEQKYGNGRKYQAGEIDLFAVYCPDNDAIHLIPAELGQERSEGRLRVVNTKNNQQQKIHWADEFELEVFLGKLREGLVELRGLEPLAS